jgi:hypothetical protein
MKFKGIEDALDRWVIVRFVGWPEELDGPALGLGDTAGGWLQFKLRGVDDFGVWLDNPYFEVSPPTDGEVETPPEQTEALRTRAFVLVKWQYVASIIYLEGKKAQHIPLGFPAPSEEALC